MVHAARKPALKESYTLNRPKTGEAPPAAGIKKRRCVWMSIDRTADNLRDFPPVIYIIGLFSPIFRTCAKMA
jgi:hypothetical protein